MTVARFEIQLGSEYLKQNHLDAPAHWEGDDMAQIIYGKFADQVFLIQSQVNFRRCLFLSRSIRLLLAQRPLMSR